MGWVNGVGTRSRETGCGDGAEGWSRETGKGHEVGRRGEDGMGRRVRQMGWGDGVGRRGLETGSGDGVGRRDGEMAWRDGLEIRGRNCGSLHNLQCI